MVSRPRVLAVLGDDTATDEAVREALRELRCLVPLECVIHYGCGGKAANGTLRARAASGDFDLMIAGASTHLALIDDANADTRSVRSCSSRRSGISFVP